MAYLSGFVPGVLLAGIVFVFFGHQAALRRVLGSSLQELILWAGVVMVAWSAILLMPF